MIHLLMYISNVQIAVLHGGLPPSGIDRRPSNRVERDGELRIVKQDNTQATINIINIYCMMGHLVCDIIHAHDTLTPTQP